MRLVENQRHLFDIPDDVHYLNCAYMSPLLNSAVQAGHAAVSAKARPWGTTPADFFSLSSTARDLFAGLINAQAGHVAIIPSVSYGTATAVLNVPLNRGDRVLVLEEEFPSNIYAWRVRAESVGATIQTLCRPEDTDWTGTVMAALEQGRARVLVLPNTHWIDGGLLDLERIAVARKEYGFSLVVDLTQSLGVIPFDVQKVRPDFLICAAYKWLLGPYSLGFMYVDAQYHAGVPLEYGWVNRPGAEDFSRLIDYTDKINPDASRFDMGERSNFQLLPIAIAALEQIHGWGPAAIERTLRTYTQRLRSELEQLGFDACEERLRSPHYLAVKCSQGLPENILQQLADAKIYLSKRGDSLRIAPHLYNNEADILALIYELKNILSKH